MPYRPDVQYTLHTLWKKMREGNIGQYDAVIRVASMPASTAAPRVVSAARLFRFGAIFVDRAHLFPLRR